jgi:hypothetical protein
MYEVVLFVHLLTIGAAFLAMGMMLYGLLQLRSAVTTAQASHALVTSAKVEKIMPVATILLLATGGYMTQDRWTWTTPWVDVSIAGLLLVTAIGAGALGGRQRALHSALDKTNGTTLDATLAARLQDPFLLSGSGLNIGLVAGVMYVMVTKPSLAIAIAAVIIGGITVAAAFSVLTQSSKTQASYDAATEKAG